MAQQQLKREISVWGSTALVLNGLIGAGIFMLPGVAATKVGLYSSFTFLICAAMMLPIFLALGENASRFTTTGGAIEYARTAFGPYWGFLTGWLSYFAGVAVIAANSNALITYIGNEMSFLTEEPYRTTLIAGICFLLTAINVVGTKQGIKTLFVFSFLKLTPLALLIVFGFRNFTLPNFEASTLPSATSMTDALMLIVYAYVGFEAALVTAGESKNPKRDIPRALMLTLLGTSIFYFLLQGITASILTNPVDSKAPLSDVALSLWGPLGAKLLSLTAMISIAGNLTGNMLSIPRYTFSLAQQGALPGFFGKVHQKYQTPFVSIVVLGTLVFALAASGTFLTLVAMASLAKILVYIISICATPRLRKALPNNWNLPWVVQGLALATCAFLLFQVKAMAWQYLTIHAVIGTSTYFAMKWMNQRAKEKSEATGFGLNLEMIEVAPVTLSDERDLERSRPNPHSQSPL